MTSESSCDFDVIVIGAGAAGLMCAIAAGQRGRRVLVVDHANKVGKKILMSGGGRCNFTNMYSGPENFISNNRHFMKSALSRYTPWDFIAMVEKHGIAYPSPGRVGALVLFVIGTADIITVLTKTVTYYLTDGAPDIHDTVVPAIVMAVDIYLIAIVLLIFGAGVYRLFVSPIEQAESEASEHPFNVSSFDQLKDKIARVVILAVIIEFFRAVVDIRFQTPLEAIYLALSVLALAAGLYLMSLARQSDN